jgi:hypothetical protein
VIRKKNMTAGFIRGLRFAARMGEVTSIVSAQQMIDSGEFKKDGYDSAEEFVVEGLGYSSMDTFQRHSKTIKALGAEMTNTLVSCGFGWKEIRMIEHVMSDEQKDAARKKNVLMIDDREISADDKERVATEVALLIEQRNSARKDLKQATKKLDGIDGEIKKGEKALLKKIDDLTALTSPVETPEHILAGFARIDKGFDDLETIIRTFAWHDAKEMILADRQLQARVEGIQQQMRARVEGLIRDWDGEVNP